MASSAPRAERLRGQHAQPLGLLVTIPALNEERTVGDIVRRVPREIPEVGWSFMEPDLAD